MILGEKISEEIIQEGTTQGGMIQEEMIQEEMIQEEMIQEEVILEELIREGTTPEGMTPQGMFPEELIQQGTIHVEEMNPERITLTGIIQGRRSRARMAPGEMIQREAISKGKEAERSKKVLPPGKHRHRLKLQVNCILTSLLILTSFSFLSTVIHLFIFIDIYLFSSKVIHSIHCHPFLSIFINFQIIHEQCRLPPSPPLKPYP